jgi:hypothetical protein
MGSSLAMIDRHHGHPAHDSREHAVSLDALAIERAVDAGSTPPPSGRWGLYRGTEVPRPISGGRRLLV